MRLISRSGGVRPPPCKVLAPPAWPAHDPMEANLSQAFETAQEKDFFDADDYEERAETFDALHRASKRSQRHRRAVRVAGVTTIALVGAAVGAWGGAGGPPGPTTAHALVTPPSQRVAGSPAKLPASPEPTPTAAAKSAATPDASPLSDEPSEPSGPRVEPTPGPERTPPARQRPPRDDRFADALRLHDGGRPDEALARLRGLGDRPEALVLRGSIHQERGDAAAARASYERYLQRYPSGAHVRAVRAILSKLPAPRVERPSPPRERARRPGGPASQSASPPRRVL